MSLRVVFMGTPDFAAASLAALLDAPDMEVAAVFTQPDKPKGRGMKLAPSPVKELALERGIAVYQPAGVRGEDVRSRRTYWPWWPMASCCRTRCWPCRAWAR